MNELSSTEFRKRFAKLTEQTTVTVNGHSIGVWMPVAEFTVKGKSYVALGMEGRSPQQRRDDLLGKINRPKR